MAISDQSDDSQTETPLLLDTVDGAVDFKGRPVLRAYSGGWRAAAFIIVVEVAERFAYCGIYSNLINYLTGPLGQSTVTAAENVNIWSGTASLFPLLGAFVADSFLGRYRTIMLATFIYILALGLLTLSAMLPFSNVDCQFANSSPCSELQVILFFFSLYLVALAQGGHKPCVQAFGADQFDREHPEERKARSSFFNWWYFTFSAGLLVTIAILNYIQDNIGWVFGFGIPCIAMVIALVVFSCGTSNYRFIIQGDAKSPFLRIGMVFVVALRNWQTTPSAIASEEEARGIIPHQGSEQFRFLNKALVAPDGFRKDGKVCDVYEVEEAKAVLRLFPIWATCLIYAVVFAQFPTFFTKQGVTLDRKIWPGFLVPAASLQCFISLSVVIFIPIYDRIVVPIARAIARESSGISMLQRIGTGMFFSIISMVVAAFVEMKRLKRARDYGLIDMPDVTIPMSIWWLIPQYVLFGISDGFTMVGLQEFFYDQIPDELRSVGLALYLSIFGVGSFLSSFVVSCIEKVTGGGGQYSWFANNLNRAHLDYFYALLAALSMVELAAFLFFSKSYIYKRVNL
ncbi:protein NRT1/ PTR FAMILY 5.10-like isoform X1 [Neltuma alba]|uniref:protein NRT1/ PTR FAMILY 5.10-like isoform X1 n=3 Tax=Neltuma alba TaxID=207710 RepID=UPI0010A36D21|nr:protein NRT1/ PTR FAMILY 5.10-like isoform X1 [Prosopis alba]XP_028799189.1 protein NRT1/ PTR FAMILY 5.10-like isoform X1 [Prosopis alba]